MSLFDERINEFKAVVEEYLENAFPKINGENNKISLAARYSLLSGGKRIRPVLCLATAKMLGLDYKSVLPFASAIEMIHAFSLIHDDLPGMDNDSLRRGKPTNHVVYGEAIAILAGDALLNKAYDNMIEECLKSNNKQSLLAMKYISQSSGENGMIGGQVIDIESENTAISFETLKKMHKMKTGALLKAPIIVPAILADSKTHVFSLLEVYAENIGMAFQIKDDILDFESTTEKMGKTIGKDANNNKSTYVTLLGIEKSKNYLITTIENANKQLNDLEKYKLDVDFLRELTYYLLNRKN